MRRTEDSRRWGRIAPVHAVLAAASEGEEPVRRLLDGFAWQLRVAMFCAGAPNIAALHANPPTEVK